MNEQSLENRTLIGKIKNIKNNVINVINQFPITILFLLAISIVSIVFIIIENYKNEILEALLLGLLLSLSIELGFEYKLLNRNKILYTIPIIASVLAYSILKIFANDYMHMAVSGFDIAIFALIFYILYINKENKLIFSHLIKSKFITSLFTYILILGIITCILAFNFLIFKFDDIWKIIGIFSIIIVYFGNYLLFFSYLPKQDEELSVPKIYRTIIHKGLFYIYLLLIFILYLYILKVILIHKMPVGKFNWFGCFSLLFYIFFYLSVDETDGLVQEKFKKYGAFIMIPILIMQTIGLYIRISSYGLTLLRYMSIAFILMGLVFIVNAIIKQPVKKSFIGIIILSLLFTCTPLNVIDVPNRSQERILKNTLSEAGAYNNGKLDENVKIDKEHMAKIESCYSYLQDSMGKKSKFYKEFEKSKIMEDLNQYSNDYDYQLDNIKDFYYYYDNIDNETLDISNYNSMRKITGKSPVFKDINKKVDNTDFFLKLKDDEKMIVYDFGDKYILFDSINYTYNKIDETFEYIEWSGFLFEK